MLAKPVIPALIFSPSLSISFFFFPFNNKFQVNNNDSLVAGLSVVGTVSNLDCTGQKDWEEKEELGKERGSWRVPLLPLSMETKAGVSL